MIIWKSNKRLPELKEGDRIIGYGYDEQGRMKNKQLPNGTSTTWKYDEKSQLTELAHRDKEGILDRYTYTYDHIGSVCPVSTKTVSGRPVTPTMPLETVPEKKNREHR